MNQDLKEFTRKLEDRTRKFSVSIYLLVDSLPNTANGNSLSNQLFRSASSIGANYREANRAKSRADFRNKIRICESEASETVYWLEIIQDLNLIKSQEFLKCKEESSELLALFTAISSRFRTKNSF